MSPFTAETPPQRVRSETALDRDEAGALSDLIDSEGWATDGEVYAEAKDAHAATTSYRKSLDYFGFTPEGMTLGGRVVENPTGEGVRLYVTWKQRRQAKADKAGKGSKKAS